MNSMHTTFLCLSACLTASALAGPIPLNGTTVYTQDFNVLSTTTNNSTSTVAWADDSTIAGWHLYRAGATSAGLVGPAYLYRVSDGGLAVGQTLMNTGHFYSIGAAGNADRALGAVPITAQGEFSCIAVFQNTGTVPVKLNSIAYQAEIRRTNQNGGNVETIAVWWRKDVTQAALFVNTTATATAAEFPAAVSTSPSGLYVTGWNRVAEADFTYSNPLANTQVDEATPVNAVPVTEIRIDPGEFFALRWGNINDGGADTLMGIDDVSLNFQDLASGIAGSVANVVRHHAGTPRIPGDDTVSFDLTVVGSGAVDPTGWKIVAPAALVGTTGAYGAATPIANVPIAEFTGTSHVMTLSLQDKTTASMSTLTSVVAPWCQINVAPVAGFTYDDMGTASAADDVVTYTLSADGTFTGTDYTLDVPAGSAAYGTTTPVTAAAPGTFTTHTFTDSADPSCKGTLSVFPPAIIGTDATTASPVPLLSLPVAQNGIVRWTVDGTARTLRQNIADPAQLDHVILSRQVDLSTVGDVRFTATMAAVTGTSSGFEPGDSFGLDLIIDGGAPVSVFTAAQDTDGDGRLTGTSELPVAVNASRTYNFTYTIPAAASSVQVRITGSSNSTAETFTVSALQLAIPQPEIAVTAPANIVRNPNGPGAADDTVSFDVTIAGQYGGSGWTTTGATPAAGAFGPVTLTVPAGGTSVTLRISDDTFPAAFQDITAALPGPYRIGSHETGSGVVPLFAAEAPAPDPAWVISGAPPTLRMNGLNLVAPLKTVTSEVVNFTGLPGAARQITANLHVHDTSAGFEAADEFNAYAIFDGDTGSPHSMISSWDTDLSGVMNGAELCPVPAVNPTIQDLNYALSVSVPSSVTTVQIVITGLCNSTNETMTLESLLIAPVSGNGDTDGDGVSDSSEAIMGTDPNNATDVLRLSQSPGDPLTITFPTEIGRFYRVYASSVTAGQESTHLQIWHDGGATIPGDGNAAQFSINPTGGVLRRFYRLHVMTTDGPWPATVP